MAAFLATIPYNMYAILSILIVLVLSFSDLEFGPMADAEYKAETTGELGSIDKKFEKEEAAVTSKGTVWDLLIPIGALIVFTILAMLYTGGYWEKGPDLPGSHRRQQLLGFPGAGQLLGPDCGLCPVPSPETADLQRIHGQHRYRHQHHGARPTSS